MPATAKKPHAWEQPKTAPAATPSPALAAVKPNGNFAGIIDELAAVRQEIDRLSKRDKELTAQVRELGAGEHDGTKARVQITVSERESFDTKTFRGEHPELAARYTKISEVTTVRIKALV